MTWRDEDAQLSPCAHCGGAARTVPGGGLMIYIRCRSCTASVYASTREAAAWAWNRRAVVR